jgi:hypothetical protein
MRIIQSLRILRGFRRFVIPRSQYFGTVFSDKAQEHLCEAKWILTQHPNADPASKASTQISGSFTPLKESLIKH